MMPNRKKVNISSLYGETEEEIDLAKAGDQVRIRLRGIEEEEIQAGFVLCLPTRPCHVVRAFEAQIVILEVRSIITTGYNCVLHVSRFDTLCDASVPILIFHPLLGSQRH
jgi:peptide chain release factor subunit 3